MTPPSPAILRVATYNIHKGVRGLGPNKRLEIHNLALGIERLDADLVFLQEVCHSAHRHAQKFTDRHPAWPKLPQAHYLAPPGYQVAYRTNAITSTSEHGNALLSRWPIGAVGHQDVSDHRFEQRGLLHVPVTWQGLKVHAIVAHLGLIHASRVRQVQRIATFIEDRVPAHEHLVLAGDFNDWGERLDWAIHAMGLARAHCPQGKPQRTFPSQLPLFGLDRMYTRGFTAIKSTVPQGPTWRRMSDHLPLLVEMVVQ